ncbi:hypothetical protein Bpla01_32320 [Burkholderia plantarii]|nr:hypothetical protein Bpla01_32320 [Burkholderia plantarii]
MALADWHRESVGSRFRFGAPGAWSDSPIETICPGPPTGRFRLLGGGGLNQAKAPPRLEPPVFILQGRKRRP